MRRILVLGGFGFFGAAAVERLRADGFKPLVGSRRAEADVQVDVEDSTSLRAALRCGDVVVDCVGPFQDRTTALVEMALDIGCDVVDIADSLRFVEGVCALQPRIDASGVRVLSACSSILAVTAAMVKLSGVADPIRVTALLAPASRFVAVPATSASLMRSVGIPIRVWRDGQMVERVGWRESRGFDAPEPIGWRRGYLFESADSVTLPRIWKSLRTAEFFVDTNALGFNWALSLAARWRVARGLAERIQPLGLVLGRKLGSSSGCLIYEAEDAAGLVSRVALTARERGYYTPIVPAVMAAEAIAMGRFEWRGLVAPHLHVETNELIGYLESIGVEFVRMS